MVVKTRNAATIAIQAELLSGGICTFLYLTQWLADDTNVGYFGANFAKIFVGLF